LVNSYQNLTDLNRKNKPEVDCCLTCVRAVRQKAKELIEFVQDDDRVRDERRKAKKTKDKYIGMAGESLSRQCSMSKLSCAL